MNIWQIFRVALRAIWRNKIRSLLTALGIIVGIAAVIAVIAIGQGASTEIQKSFSNMGNNLMMIFPGSMMTGGKHMGSGMSTTLVAEDGEQIQEQLPDMVRAVTPIVRFGGQVVYKEQNWSSQIQGCGVQFPLVRSWEVADGSFFSEAEVRSGSRVVLLGQTVAEQLFGGELPLGKTIRIRNMPFRVIGVMQPKGSNSMGMDQDDIMIMPYTTVKKVLQRSKFNNVNQILISLHRLDQREEAKKEITALLRQRHKIRFARSDDFTIRDMTEIVNSISSVSRLMTLLLATVASISLLVGGIGIMNIMLVSVTERTREIGLRMAIGARPRDILMQFLLEAMALSCVGGLIGVAGGVAGAKIVGSLQHWPILITQSSVVISFGFSALVGIAFGFFPAWRASRLNPIDCLRYE